MIAWSSSQTSTRGSTASSDSSRTQRGGTGLSAWPRGRLPKLRGWPEYGRHTHPSAGRLCKWSERTSSGRGRSSRRASDAEDAANVDLGMGRWKKGREDWPRRVWAERRKVAEESRCPDPAFAKNKRVRGRRRGAVSAFTSRQLDFVWNDRARSDPPSSPMLTNRESGAARRASLLLPILHAAFADGTWNLSAGESSEDILSGSLIKRCQNDRDESEHGHRRNDHDEAHCGWEGVVPDDRSECQEEEHRQRRIGIASMATERRWQARLHEC